MSTDTPSHRAENMTQFTFQLPKQLKMEIEVEAKRQRRSKGSLISIILEDYFASKESDVGLAAEDSSLYNEAPSFFAKKISRQKKA